MRVGGGGNKKGENNHVIFFVQKSRKNKKGVLLRIIDKNKTREGYLGHASPMP